MSKWEITEDASHWLEVVSAVSAYDDPAPKSYTVALKEGGTAAVAKWDGCVHLVLDGSYLHICDLDDLIVRLTELREMARARGFEGYGDG